MTNTIERVSELSTFNEPELLRGSMFQYENQAHTFVIECTQDGQHVDLQGDITARFMRADRNTVYLAPAAQDPDQEAVANDLTSIDSQGRAVVTLHRDCYNVGGRFQLTVYNVNSGRTVCIYACVGAIRLTQSGALIDSGEAFDPASFSDDIATLGTLIQQTNAAKDAANAAAASVAGDIADLKSALASYEDAVVLVKNLAGELTLDKYANSDTGAGGGNIRFYDSDTRGYVKIRVKPNTKYAINLSATDGFSANFSWWAYESSWENGTAISKVSIDSNCITTSPANANLLYLTANNPASANVYVVLEQETSIHGATVAEYPYNEPKAVVIDDLQLDSSKYELHNVDVSCIYDSVLSFVWDSTNNYMTISTDRTGNNLFVLTSNLGAKILTYSDLGAKSWNVPHGNALIYLFNRTQFVTKTEQEMNALTEPYVVLAYLSSNGSGGNLQISGIWEKYWIKQGLTQKINEINNTLSVSGIYGDLPDYYYTDDYFTDKLQSVRDNMNFKNGVCFAFITDTHFYSNQLQSRKMLTQIMKKTQVPFVIFGGDAPRLTGDMDGLNADIATLQTYVDAVGRENWYAVRGNHDFYDRTTEEQVADRTYYTKTEGEVYNLLMKSSEHRMTNGDPDHMCYYIDIPAQKTRIIVLNTTDPQGTVDEQGHTTEGLGGGAVSEAQAAWLVSAINAVENTNIIVISHIPSDLTLAWAEATNVKYIRWILKAFAAGTDVESEIGGVRYTFTGTTNNLICSISGHNHVDADSTTSGYLSIVTTCDALYQNDGYGATAGTILEQAFDVYCIDYDTFTVKTVRFGRGNNRNWVYPHNE